MDKTILDWVGSEIGVEGSQLEKLGSILEHYGVSNPPTEREKLLIRWREYSGDDFALACMLENLHRVCYGDYVEEKDSLFEWRARELCFWWKHFFSCKHMIGIQPMNSPTGFAYYMKREADTLHLEKFSVEATPLKYDGVWQDYLNKRIEREIVSVTVESGEISHSELIDGLSSGGMRVMLNYSLLGSDKPSPPLVADAMCGTGSSYSYSRETGSYDVIVSDGIDNKKAGVIWCPYVLCGVAMYAVGNRLKTVDRMAFCTDGSEWYGYRGYKLVS